MLRAIIVVPFLAVLVIFFLYNNEPITMAFPFLKWTISVGIFALLLGIASFLIGALTLFISLVKQWNKVRKANKQIQELEKKLNELREQYINQLTQSSAEQASNHVPTPVSQEPVNVIGHSAEVDAQN